MSDLQELSGLPEYDGMEDEDFPPATPADSPGQGDPDRGDPSAEGEGELSKLVEVPAAKTKGVKRPQPKLDSQRLTSVRGLPALRTLFDDVRFKGKGHEAEDLRMLMQKIENWAHRLYPKLQFQDFIDKVEKLGSKKDVQTCLKRIRLDMPLTHEDATGEEAEPSALQDIEDLDLFSALVHSTPAPAALPPPPSPPPSLSEEQHRRVEQNRQRALERRLARHQQADPSDSQTVRTSESETSDVPHRSRGQEEEEPLEEPEEEKVEPQRPPAAPNHAENLQLIFTLQH